MQYPARFTPTESGRFVVTFRDIPEAITQGDDEADAADMAADALITAMDFYFEDQRQVPAPSAAVAGERLVELPISVASKVLLLNAMIEQRVTQADLARRMGTRPQEVQRIVDLRHASKIDTVADALRAVGKRVELVVS